DLVPRLHEARPAQGEGVEVDAERASELVHREPVGGVQLGVRPTQLSGRDPPASGSGEVTERAQETRLVGHRGERPAQLGDVTPGGAAVRDRAIQAGSHEMAYAVVVGEERARVIAVPALHLDHT